MCTISVSSYLLTTHLLCTLHPQGRLVKKHTFTSHDQGRNQLIHTSPLVKWNTLCDLNARRKFEPLVFTPQCQHRTTLWVLSWLNLLSLLEKNSKWLKFMRVFGFSSHQIYQISQLHCSMQSKMWRILKCFYFHIQIIG
jgi:hypothetical protein